MIKLNILISTKSTFLSWKFLIIYQNSISQNQIPRDKLRREQILYVIWLISICTARLPHTKLAQEFNMFTDFGLSTDRIRSRDRKLPPFISKWPRPKARGIFLRHWPLDICQTIPVTWHHEANFFCVRSSLASNPDHELRMTSTVFHFCWNCCKVDLKSADQFNV